MRWKYCRPDGNDEAGARPLEAGSPAGVHLSASMCSARMASSGSAGTSVSASISGSAAVGEPGDVLERVGHAEGRAQGHHHGGTAQDHEGGQEERHMGVEPLDQLACHIRRQAAADEPDEPVRGRRYIAGHRGNAHNRRGYQGVIEADRDPRGNNCSYDHPAVRGERPDQSEQRGNENEADYER